LIWNDGGTGYNGVEFKVDFDESVVTFTSCALAEPYASYPLAVCGLVFGDTDTFEIGLIDDFVSPGPVPSGTLGTVTFQIASDAAFGPSDLTIPIDEVVLPGDPTVDTDDGVVTVLGPVFSGTPSALNGMSVIQNLQAPAPTQDLTVDNTGANGTTLNGTCGVTADPGGVFSVQSGAAFRAQPLLILLSYFVIPVALLAITPEH